MSGKFRVQRQFWRGPSVRGPVGQLTYKLQPNNTPLAPISFDPVLAPAYKLDSCAQQLDPGARSHAGLLDNVRHKFLKSGGGLNVDISRGFHSLVKALYAVFIFVLPWKTIIHSNLTKLRSSFG